MKPMPRKPPITSSWMSTLTSLKWKRNSNQDFSALAACPHPLPVAKQPVKWFQFKLQAKLLLRTQLILQLALATALLERGIQQRRVSLLRASRLWEQTARDESPVLLSGSLRTRMNALSRTMKMGRKLAWRLWGWTLLKGLKYIF